VIDEALPAFVGPGTGPESHRAVLRDHDIYST
jgi:hypothetical protein